VLTVFGVRRPLGLRGMSSVFLRASADDRSNKPLIGTTKDLAIVLFVSSLSATVFAKSTKPEREYVAAVPDAVIGILIVADIPAASPTLLYGVRAADARVGETE